MRQSWAGRLGAISVIVDRAIERGELPAGTDPAAFMHAMSAPLYYRLLVTCEPVTERDANLGAAAALAAAGPASSGRRLTARASRPAHPGREHRGGRREY